MEILVWLFVIAFAVWVLWMVLRPQKFNDSAIMAIIEGVAELTFGDD